MAHIGYLRVSTSDQSLEAQRSTLGSSFDREFTDEGISGAIKALDRPGFAELMRYVRDGDTVHVAALDRLGRDALDVQATVRLLLEKGVALDVKGLGPIGRGVGELIIAVLAQIADIERERIRERCEAGRAAARESLAATGKTHRGKASLGRPFKNDAAKVATWRRENNASLAQTMKQFGLGRATVARYCAATKTTGQDNG